MNLGKSLDLSEPQFPVCGKAVMVPTPTLSSGASNELRAKHQRSIWDAAFATVITLKCYCENPSHSVEAQGTAQTRCSINL